jgi:hypothetical protein
MRRWAIAFSHARTGAYIILHRQQLVWPMQLDFIGHCANELLHTLTRDRRDRKKSSLVRLGPRAQSLNPFRLIERIDLGGYDNLPPLSQLAVVRRQLAIYDLVIVNRIAA